MKYLSAEKFKSAVNVSFEKKNLLHRYDLIRNQIYFKLKKFVRVIFKDKIDEFKPLKNKIRNSQLSYSASQFRFRLEKLILNLSSKNFIQKCVFTFLIHHTRTNFVVKLILIFCFAECLCISGLPHQHQC